MSFLKMQKAWKRLFPLLVVALASMSCDRFLEGLPSVEEIQQRINTAYDKLFRQDEEGNLLPHVCTVCDEFLMSPNAIQVLTIDRMKTVRPMLLWTSLPDSERIPEVEAYYKFKDKLPVGTDADFVQGMALSPRGAIYRKNSRSKPGFTCCQNCLSSLTGRNAHVPFYAVVNKNYVGCAPECLKQLNDVELSLLSPVSTHGYCFSHTGGTQMQLKGTLAFMRIQERRIIESAAAMDNLKLTQHVVVLCHGRMTDAQRKRVAERTKVDTGKIIEAAKWLCSNHLRWKNVNYDEIKKELEKKRVIRVDHSETVESTNATVESEEIFTCYYPEGAANETSGGFDDPEAFIKFADEMARKNFNVELQVDLQKEFVKDNDADQLTGASLLQFPFGRGGLDEVRQTKDGSSTSSPDVHKFLQHLSRLSNPEFQTPLIQLISYSMISRARLLKRSRLQVKSDKTAKDLAEGLNYEDLHETIRQRGQNNWYGGTRVSRKLLDSVEACTRALPHTNEAAKSARNTAESMQHYLGSGSIFLTVTFDDDNSLLMQVLSGVEVDDDEDLNTLSDKDLRARRRERRQIRLKYPGIAAIHFEMLFDILVKEVIGWDMEKNCPTGKPGFFGIPEGLCAAQEEQGRKTIHTHMTVWIKGYKRLQRAMFFGTTREKLEAERVVQQYYDRIASTALFSCSEKSTLALAWDHECTQASKRQRTLPVVVPDQELRNLRHRKGYSETDGCIARCPHCDLHFTYEQMVCGYLSTQGVPGYDRVRMEMDKTEKMEIPRHRCFADVVQYQKNFSLDSRMDAPTASINAAYQSHNSCHTDGCFRCTKKGGKNKKEHKCGPNCECRYRMPDRKRKHTCIKTEYKGAPWYTWNGEKLEQPIVQICAKRGNYDLFQNISCPAISLSKFACNSNIQLITDGPVGQYQIKYNFKPTQEDDTREYSGVDKSMKNLNGRVHESDRSEAIRRITRAAFAHNKTNVISPSFASYLTRNDSRFYFSHEFTFCPLKDIMKLHRNEQVGSVLRYNGEGTACYFECQALHYLCRPQEIEDVSVKEFFERYEVSYVHQRKRKRGDEDNPVMPFQADTGFFRIHQVKSQRTVRKLRFVKGSNAGRNQCGLK